MHAYALLEYQCAIGFRTLKVSDLPYSDVVDEGLQLNFKLQRPGNTYHCDREMPMNALRHNVTHAFAWRSEFDLSSSGFYS